jgi:regulator of RNase E activity RraA
VGDEDGVVVIPAAKLDAAAATARTIVSAEKKLERAVRRGEDLGTLLGIAAKIERRRAEGVVPQLGKTHLDKDLTRT